MKVNFNIILVVLLVFSFAVGACGPAAPEADSQASLKVLAVETFLAEIAQNVAGERAKVESLIPLGMDPHAFEPTPQDVKKISESSVLILNGAGFEEWATKTLNNAGGERLVIEASAGLTSREAREGEEAVMSPEEKADAVCTDLGGKSAVEEVVAGPDAAGAVDLHHAGESSAADAHQHEAEVLSLKLTGQDGAFGGFVKFDVAEDGEYVFAASGGNLTVTDASGGEMEVEEALPVDCSGLNGGILLDLEPGEYVIALSDLTVETTPFFAASAGGHHHHLGDPHFWLDPTKVVKYVENIRDGLVAADPQGKDIYTANAANYIARLTELDTWITAQVEQIPAERRLIVTNHESFGYFADRYNFKIIGTVVPSVSSNASPSAQQLARLVDRIKATGATAIFLETGSSPQLAEQVAAETGVKVVSDLYTHSVTETGGKAPTYIDMMKYNVTTIVDALK